MAPVSTWYGSAIQVPPEVAAIGGIRNNVAVVVDVDEAPLGEKKRTRMRLRGRQQGWLLGRAEEQIAERSDFRVMGGARRTPYAGRRGE